MNWKPVALLPILTLWACAEGGTRGSGISTTVAGNVAVIQTTALPRRARSGSLGFLAELREFFRIETVARARTAIEGIHVAIEGTDVQGQTDANGSFSLQGDFHGHVNVVFQPPDDGGPARLAIDVPAAGTLTLHNVRLDTARGEAVPETQDVDFEGIITDIDCQGFTLTLVSAQDNPPDTDQYVLRLDTSSLLDAEGNPLSCGDLRGGDQATVRGTVNPDGTFGHATVEVDT